MIRSTSLFLLLLLPTMLPADGLVWAYNVHPDSAKLNTCVIVSNEKDLQSEMTGDGYQADAKIANFPDVNWANTSVAFVALGFKPPATNSQLVITRKVYGTDKGDRFGVALLLLDNPSVNTLIVVAFPSFSPVEKVRYCIVPGNEQPAGTKPAEVHKVIVHGKGKPEPLFQDALEKGSYKIMPR